MPDVWLFLEKKKKKKPEEQIKAQQGRWVSFMPDHQLHKMLFQLFKMSFRITGMPTNTPSTRNDNSL